MENHSHLDIPVSPIIDSQTQADEEGIDYIFDRTVPEMSQSEDQGGNKNGPVGYPMPK
ncbi:MAG TPA: hypothetical protein VIM64_16165 [Puia sp.]